MAKQQGIVYIAYGDKAREATVKSSDSHNQEYSIIGDRGNIVFTEDTNFNSPIQKSRWAKVNLAETTPYLYTFYLDADTQYMGLDSDELKKGYRLLRDGSGS